MSHDFLIPAPIDVRSLDTLEAAVLGGFLLAPLERAQEALERLRDDDMGSSATRFVLTAVRAVAGNGEQPTVTAVAAHAHREALVPASNLPHLDVLLADLTGPDACPAGAGELVRVPDLVNAGARRKIRATATRTLQVVDEASDVDLREVAPELGRDLWRAAQRIYGPEVSA